MMVIVECGVDALIRDNNPSVRQVVQAMAQMQHPVAALDRSACSVCSPFATGNDGNDDGK